MKILCIFDGRRATAHLQVDYLFALSKWFDVFIYGPGEYELNDRNISPIQFSKDLDIVSLCKHFHPDIVILPEYASTKILLGFLGDLNRVKSIPVVSIEDYILIEDKQWHLSNGIDYVISRSPVVEGFFSVSTIWLPWAAGEMFGTPTTAWHDRYNKVLFVGEGLYSQSWFYTTRKKAIYMLGTNNLLDSFRSSSLEFYIEKLNSYRYFLSDAFHALKTVPAKTFEAMAMGCSVLSPEITYYKELFGDEECFIQYDMECEDLLDNVCQCMSEPEHSYNVALSGRKVVLEKHMFSSRIQELKEILEDIVGKSGIRRKWGV